jgi:ATP-binding protein involved in chromosome partitioning
MTMSPSNMSPANISPADVMRALELVKLPASGQSLAASGRVGGVAVDGGKVMFALHIDPTEAAAMEPVRQAAERAVCPPSAPRKPA